MADDKNRNTGHDLGDERPPDSVDDTEIYVLDSNLLNGKNPAPAPAPAPPFKDPLPPPCESPVASRKVRKRTITPPKVSQATLEGQYEFDRLLGKGGMGEIWLTRDQRLERQVAIKVVRRGVKNPDEASNALGDEARLTAGLQHPNIIPIHDIGITDDGGVFYAMKRVRGKSLRDILATLRIGGPATTERYSLIKLVAILHKVCQAIAFAHAEGVLHRDLKPANIMVGDYGEVLIIDWGLARKKPPRISGQPPEPDEATIAQGTPSYLPPEEVRYGYLGNDERSDVYSLGALLYQILTWHPPFRKKRSEDFNVFIKRVVETAPIPPQQRAGARQLPPDLVSLATRCLQKRPEDRIQTAGEMALELVAHIEGTKAKAARQEEAALANASANAAVDRLGELQSQLHEMRVGLIAASADTPPWSTAEQRKLLYRAETRIHECERDLLDAHNEAVEYFHQALSHVPEDRVALSGLADLYWDRFKGAEAVGAEQDRMRFEALIRIFDEDRYRDRLRGEGELSIQTDPEGCQVELSRRLEMERRFVYTESRELGQTPIPPRSLQRGRYLLTIEGLDGLVVRYPVNIDRGSQVLVDIPMHLQIPDGLLVIPRGPFPYGESSGLTVDLPAFAIGRFLVTFREYLEFIAFTREQDRFEAWMRLPRSRGIPGHHWKWDGSTYQLESPGVSIEPDFPVVGISQDDARTYCWWLSMNSGRQYRLPAEEEWEKAARGPDGRLYPWGNQFDPSFCLMRETRRGGSALEAVGSVPGDESPYGVRDMAGLVKEWCSSGTEQDEFWRPVRGGSWIDPSFACNVTRRNGLPEDTTADDLGFRVVLDLEAERRVRDDPSTLVDD